jgi:recombination protein RecT
MSEETKLTRPAAVSIKEYVQSDLFKAQVGEALPKGVELDRFIRCFYTQIQKTPKLMGCDKASLMASLIKCAEFGLFPNGYEAHLIPYGTTCTVIIDYKGLVKLLYQSGAVSKVYASIVCEEDVFVFDCGSVKEHFVDFRKARGEPFAAYCIVTMKDGTTVADCMSKAEVEAIRKRSKSGSGGPWATDWAEMAKKTVLKRTSKLLPLSAEDRRVIYEDDDNPDFSKVKRVNPIDSIEMPEGVEG